MQGLQTASPWRLSVAPMMDWTDRHCRYFHRQLSHGARLYTEMITTGALLHGNVERLLRFDAVEHPVALQLGGSDPTELAHCALFGVRRGYDEINLNCCCPSERVQRGSIGACLMADPALVADCVKAMVDAVDVPVTVKQRIGIDRVEDYGFARDFVGTVAEAGCRVFMVHARNAWLKGLSPKENRNIPPLRYELVYRLKREFPDLTVVINGGIRTDAEIAGHLQHVDGVMIGREAYHNPWSLKSWGALLPGVESEMRTREQVEDEMVRYMERERSLHGMGWYGVARHMLGLYHGMPGARGWRQVWSDHRLKERTAAEVAVLARARRLGERVDKFEEAFAFA